MRRKLEDAIEDEGSTLEEYIAPVPAVIFDDMVSFSLDPEVEGNESYSADPSSAYSQHTRAILRPPPAYLMTCVAEDRPSGMRKHANANMQYATKSLGARDVSD